MITTAALVTFMRPFIPAEYKFVGSSAELPDKPDLAVALSRTPGGREEMEGLQDRGGFTLRFRGRPTDTEGPEEAIIATRIALSRTVIPVEIGPWLIRSVWPSGPSYPLPGPDSGRRFEYVQVFNLQTGNIT